MTHRHPMSLLFACLAASATWAQAPDPQVKAQAEGYLAFRGCSRIGNRNDDPAYLFKDGFALDFRCRPQGDQKSDQPVRGDRRLVFGRHKGTWTAVLYDYVNPDVPLTAGMAFVSPVVSTPMDQVVALRRGRNVAGLRRHHGRTPAGVGRTRTVAGE